MRKIFFLVLLLSSFSRGYSAYLVNIPQTIKQPDGTILHCLGSGDEFYSWLHDSLGYTIVKNPQTGYYVYALSDASGGIVASNHVVGIADPVALGLSVNVRIASELIMAKRAEFEESIPKRQHKAGSNSGKINNLVVFVRFADETGFSKNFDYMEKVFNDSTSLSTNSMYNFYRLASYGQLYITSHFYPAPSEDILLSYQDTFPRSYFQPYDSVDNPNGFPSYERTSREHDLLGRVVEYMAASVPNDLDLDYDGDGYVDNVVFMVSGDPIVGGEILWPHRWSLSSTTVSINGKRVYDYNINLENINGNNTSAGVITHEMMHTLGAPDLYRYNDQAIQPVGTWDLMASTNYTRAQGLGAYMKSKYGKWIPDLPIITDTGTYTLYPVNDSTMIYDPEKPIGYRINLPNNSNEYIVLEYRKTNACIFEENLPGSGILIYRINSTRNGNANADGENRYDEVHIFRPNGKKLVSTNDNGNISLAHFAANLGRTSLDETTTACPFYCNGDTITTIAIANITTAGDSIQFTYLKGVLTVDKEQVALAYYPGDTATISVESYTSWTITGIDTSWLDADILSGNNGKTAIKLSTRSQNNLRVPKSCTFAINYDVREKYVTVSQGIQPILSCEGVNNQCAGDVIMEYDFQQYGVNAVSEYFAATNDVQVIDSVSFYFGNITLVDSLDDAIRLEIYTSNAANRPGTTLLTQNIAAKDLKPNSWNTIRLREPIVTSRGLTVGYAFTRADADFLKINIYQNDLRTEPYYGTMLVRQQDGVWRKPSEVSFPEIKNYSLAMKLLVCPASPPTDTLLVSTTNLPLTYDSNIQISFNIISNTSWEILNLPEGYSISQSSGTGNANLVLTTLTKHREAAKKFYFLVRSGSIIHSMTIDRASYPLISSKKEVELNYEGTDSADVNITAVGTSWEAQTDCSWLELSRTTGNAGLQRLVIYPTGENYTGATLEGCVDIVSTTLNEQICILVRQNSYVGIQTPTDASTLLLYPNPATSKLSVHNANVLMQTIVVYNVVGKEVLKISDVNNSYTELNIADFQAGIYFVKVSSEKGTQVRKFVKNGKY